MDLLVFAVVALTFLLGGAVVLWAKPRLSFLEVVLLSFCAGSVLLFFLGAATLKVKGVALWIVLVLAAIACLFFAFKHFRLPQDKSDWAKKNAPLLISLSVLLLFSVWNYSSVVSTPLSPGNSDPVSYHEWAQKIAAGDGSVIDAYFTPSWKIWLGTVYKFAGDDVRTAKVYNFILMLIVALFLYYIGSFIIGSNYAGLITLVVFLFDPFAFHHVQYAYKEMAFLFCLVALVFLTILLFKDLNLKERLIILASMAGILVVGAFSNSWLYGYLVVLPVYFWLNQPKWFDKLSFKKVGIFAGSLVVLTIVFVSIFNLTVFVPQGKWYTTLTNSGILLYFGNNPTPHSNVAFTSTYPEGLMDPLNNFSVEKMGVGFENLTDKEKSSVATSFVLNFWKSNPSFLINRVKEFLFKYWFFPNLDWAQRLVENPKKVLFISWVRWILGLIGIIILIASSFSRSSIILGNYALVSVAYGLSNYLLRYKLYFAVFSPIAISAAIFFILLLLIVFFKQSKN
jgi:hypothetical protein